MEQQNMVEEYNCNYLSPDVRTIEKIGSTGSGKTLSDLLFTTKEARLLFSRTVGEGSATLRDQTKVFTEKLTNHMIVAVKLPYEIFSWEKLIELLSKVLLPIIKSNYKESQAENADQLQRELFEGFQREMTSTKNTEAQTRLLQETNRQKISNEMANYFTNFLQGNIQIIYQEAKNSLPELEGKPKSRKLDEAIIQRLLDKIDREPELLKKLHQSHDAINQELMEFFFRYFSQRQKSKDDYYYQVVDLDHIDRSSDFINAMFSNNNLHTNQQLSIEVICSELVIYAPMNQEVTKIIRSNEKMVRVFEGMDRRLSLGMRDTRGLYHEGADPKVENERLQELLYHNTYDALMIVCPIFGDPNLAKLREDVKSVLRNYSKQIPIILLNNKVDLLIDDQYKKSVESSDLFSFDELLPKKVLTFSNLKNVIDSRVQSILNEFNMTKQKNTNSLYPVTCYFKAPNQTDTSIMQDIYNAYGPYQALQQILDILSNSLYQSSKKVRFILDEAVDEGKLPYAVIHSKLRELMAQTYTDTPFYEKTRKAVLKNIDDNLGKTPHGQGFNALGRHIAYGQGWSSNIDEERFVNCESFSVNFPANVRGMPTASLLDKILSDCVKYTKGHFEKPEDLKRINEYVKAQVFDTYEFTANLLYRHAFLVASHSATSYYNRFNQFLKISRSFFNLTGQEMIDLNENSTSGSVLDYYTDAMVREIKRSLNFAFHLHVYIK